MQFIDDEQLSPLSSGELKEDMRFWVSQFLEQKELDRIAPKSLKSYSYALDTFISFVSKYSTQNSMQGIGAKFINRYLIEYQSSLAAQKLSEGKGLSEDKKKSYKKIVKQKDEKFLGKNDAHFEILHVFDNSLTHRLSVVKMLLKYISDNNEEEHDYTPLFRKFATIKHKEKFSEYITLDEMDQVIALMNVWPNEFKQYMPKSSFWIAQRDSLLILIYALTGARSEEVVKIKLEDLSVFMHNDREYYSIKILEGKGGNIREIGVESGFIKPHIEFMRECLPNESFYLSSVKINGVYVDKFQHQDNIRKFGNKILKILGIHKTGLHTFRRGYATRRVMHDGMDVSIVAKEMGNTISIIERFYLKHDAKLSV